MTPDDVQDVAGPVLRVRVSGDFADIGEFIDELLGAVPTPTFS